MATPAQVHSNRTNAKHSTGSKTETGKSASSKNTIKHGSYAKKIVLCGDERLEFAAFRQSLLAERLPKPTRARDLFLPQRSRSLGTLRAR